MMHIGLLGFGVVGGGVWALCAPRDDLNVKRVLLRSPKEGLPEEVVTFNADDILNDPEIDTVVEVMGGLHPAYEYVSAALARGKNVVTANKALIAAYYTELTALAREKGAALRCTAAVGGGIPWLTNLERVKRLDTVCAVGGIMNGTTNFIMDAMHKAPVDFPAILKEAQDLGYAEADPSADIDGDDIRRKLCISANIAFDAALEETAIPTFGIRTVTAADIAAFQSHGFACKLLARAESTENGVCAYVEPTLVDAGDLEAAVPANFNLITYEAEQLGRQSFYGQGAGRFPTAENVVQDCLTVLSGKRGFYTDRAVSMLLTSGEAHPYYVRTSTPDFGLADCCGSSAGPSIAASAHRVTPFISSLTRFCRASTSRTTAFLFQGRCVTCWPGLRSAMQNVGAASSCSGETCSSARTLASSLRACLCPALPSCQSFMTLADSSRTSLMRRSRSRSKRSCTALRFSRVRCCSALSASSSPSRLAAKAFRRSITAVIS